MSEHPPARVRVTGPPRRARRLPTRVGLDAETPLGSLYVGALMRAQRAAAVRSLLVLVLSVGSLPLVFHLAPGLSEVHVLGVPLPWLVVGVAVHPVLILIGWRHLHRTEQIERDVAELLSDHSDHPDHPDYPDLDDQP